MAGAEALSVMLLCIGLLLGASTRSTFKWQRHTREKVLSFRPTEQMLGKRHCPLELDPLN